MGVIERTYRALSADRGAILRRQVFRHLNDPVDRRAQAAVTLLVTRARLSRTGEHQTPDDATRRRTEFLCDTSRHHEIRKRYGA